VVSEFPTDYIFGTGGEVAEIIQAVEELAASDQVDGKQRVRVVRRFGKKTPCIQNMVRSWGGGVLTYEEARVDDTCRKVGGPS
jgi:hypothetical protein